MGIGTELARARTDAGLSVAEVSKRTRVREHILRGMEAEDFSVCRGQSYARGHLRAYAEAVGVDPAPLMRAFDATAPVDAAGSPVLPLPVPAPRRRVWRWAVLLVVLVLVGILTSVLLSRRASAAGYPTASVTVSTTGLAPSEALARVAS